MTTIIKVMESLVKMNGWTVIRFDLQAYHNGAAGYAGYLDILENDSRITIYDNGSFEFSK